MNHKQVVKRNKTSKSDVHGTVHR